MEEKYWIWLARLKNIKNTTLLKLINKYGSPDKIHNLAYQELIENGINQKEIDEIQKAEYRENNEKYLNYMRQNNIELITIKSQDYPDKLKNISDPPLVLFIKGNKQLLNSKAIAIVRLQRCKCIWKTNCRKNGI